MEINAAHPLLEWVKATPIGDFVRNSTWAFPALQSLHFIGMSLLIGVVGVIDLRILGVARGLPIHPLHRFLPLAFVGFGINHLGAVTTDLDWSHHGRALHCLHQRTALAPH